MAGRKGHENDPNERKRKSDRDELPRGRTVWKRPKPAETEQHAGRDELHPNWKFRCACGYETTDPRFITHQCPDRKR